MRTMDELVGSDPATRRDELNDLGFQIIAHMNAEEQTIYPAFEALEGEYRSLAIKNEEEHQVGRYILNGLRDKGLSDEHWAGKLRVLRDILVRHAESEERVMLDQALDLFTEEEIDRMSRHYEVVEAELFKQSRMDLMI